MIPGNDRNKSWHLKNAMIAIEVNKVSVEPMMLLAGLDRREGSDGVINTDALKLASFKSANLFNQSFISAPGFLVKAKSLLSRKANYYYVYHYIKNKSEVLSKALLNGELPAVFLN
ncbi:hypothetical protein CA600_07070 [Paenibacillus sp. VTT E-133280]|uniref:hypothetical protein n=2 Tax=Paenibacillus TaxID=44249 RepID=UPI000BA0D204|nr:MULTISPECIES: hypothetical protein [unclassified Paenibacillus]MDH6369252.1 hypothetical protein [Paenibacillus sp. PastF-3]OZQ68016.1 hypothetical protein CA600_07070 [Paenibacillus sp. VTT E-133280]